jgi:hypothetical protein
MRELIRHIIREELVEQSTKSSNDEFIKKQKEIHGDKYDYSLTDYQGRDNPVTIKCPKHGPFTLLAKNAHRGCPKCNIENRRVCKKGGNTEIQPEDIKFFEKFYEMYGFIPYVKEMERLGTVVKVGDIYPEHPAAHLNTKSYYQQCLTKVFEEIRKMVAEKLGLILSDTERGQKRFITNDGKYHLRSIHEVIFYNVFALNNESDNLEVDSRKFYGKCDEIQKEVDFIYKNKTVIEIAGMSTEGYFDKINSAMKCIQSLGYNTIVYNTRQTTKASSYYEFYEKICNDFNFPVDEKIKSNVLLLIGHNNLSVDDMKDFINKNIGSVSQVGNPHEFHKLKVYIKKLYGKTIREYRKDLGIKQKNR